MLVLSCFASSSCGRQRQQQCGDYSEDADPAHHVRLQLVSAFSGVDVIVIHFASAGIRNWQS